MMKTGQPGTQIRTFIILHCARAFHTSVVTGQVKASHNVVTQNTSSKFQVPSSKLAPLDAQLERRMTC